jgi:hypothetical protein
LWKLRPVTLRLLDLVARVAAKMGGSSGPSQDIATLRQTSAHAPGGPVATSNPKLRESLAQFRQKPLCFMTMLESRNVHWLRDCLGPIKKKGCDSFKRFLPDVYRTVNAIARFRPIYFLGISCGIRRPVIIALRVSLCVSSLSTCLTLCRSFFLITA